MKTTMKKCTLLLILLFSFLLSSFGQTDEQIALSAIKSLIKTNAYIQNKSNGLKSERLNYSLGTDNKFINGDGYWVEGNLPNTFFFYHKNSKVASFVWGVFRDKWNTVGNENGILGWPTKMYELSYATQPNGAVMFFQNGSIYWSPKTGAYIVNNDVIPTYKSVSGPFGKLGYPTSDMKFNPVFETLAQTFQGGAILKIKDKYVVKYSDELKTEYGKINKKI